MTNGQKILIIVTSLTVSVVAGGVLYLYIQRKNILTKLSDGESVTYKTKEPKASHHKGSEYSLKVMRDANSTDGLAILLYQGEELRGQYWLINEVPYYVTDKEKIKTPIEDKSEARFIKYLLNNL
jgi:hypothetical protein